MTSDSKKRGASHSPAPSKKSHKSSKSTSSAVSVPLPARSHPPNLVLPTWNDTFHTTPRNLLPVDEDENAGSGTGKLAKTMKFVTNVLFSGSPGENQSPSVDEAMAAAHHAKSLLLPHAFKDMKEKERLYKQFGKCLPRAYDVIASSASASSSSGSSKKGKGKSKVPEPVDASSDGNVMEDVLRGCEKVVVIGVHGWFPGAIVRTVAGKVRIISYVPSLSHPEYECEARRWRLGIVFRLHLPIGPSCYMRQDCSSFYWNSPSHLRPQTFKVPCDEYVHKQPYLHLHAHLHFPLEWSCLHSSSTDVTRRRDSRS